MSKWQRAKYQPNLPLGPAGARVTACKEHRMLSKEAAKETMVLLKNEQHTLPLAEGTKVALFGKATFDYVKGGGGSGDVTVSYIKNIYDGLNEIPDHIYIEPELASFYRKKVKHQYAKGIEPGMTKEPLLTDEQYKRARAFADTAIISLCRFSGEGWDRRSKFDAKTSLPSDKPVDPERETFEDGDFYLTANERTMIEQVKQYFPHIIVVLNVGGMVDTSWFVTDDKIQSVLLAWQGGMEGGAAAAELLCGKGNPSGKLSDTFARSLEAYPSSSNFHENDKYVNYTDDIYVGYRYFETLAAGKDQVNYPFGYGLSYTTFSRKIDTIIGADDTSDVLVQVTVTNTGRVPGKEVVQIYGSVPQGVLYKPSKCLIAFEKTRCLAPGEQQILRFSVSLDALASYDDLGKIQQSAYVLEKGEYTIWAGTSVQDVECAATITREQDQIVRQLSRHLAPTALPKRLLANGEYEELPQSEGNDPNEYDLPLQDKVGVDGLTPAYRQLDGVLLWSWRFKPGIHPFTEVVDGTMTLDDFVEQMTDEELMHLVGGQPNTGVANTFGIGNMPEYGIPNIMTADGPAGLRVEKETGVTTTAWPCATGLACSWNTDLVYQVGRAAAKEVKENNIGVWLAPGVNIHRSPLCGRNFEYYSEDPLLAGKIGVAMVRGVQSQHIAATVKHFACNNKETDRKDSDSRVSERALREIYLKAFEIIVAEADPWCIMTSYNIINGHRASECSELLQGILRDEWNYQGMVTSDWWTFGEHYKEVLAGNDLKMACGFPDRLKEAMKKGLIQRQDLIACAKRILQLILKID